MSFQIMCLFMLPLKETFSRHTVMFLTLCLGVFPLSGLNTAFGFPHWLGFQSRDESQLEQELDGSEICSLFEAMKLNAMAIETCDVLIAEHTFLDTVESEHDGAKGVLQEFRKGQRITVDFKRKRFAIAVAIEKNTLDTAAADDISKELRITTGCCIDTESQRVASFYGGRKKSDRDFQDYAQVNADFANSILRSNFYGDPRSFGLVPGHWGSDFKTTVSEWLDQRAAGNGFIRSRDLGKGMVEIVYTSYDVKEKKQKGRHIVKFDTSKNTPVSFRGESWMDSGVTAAGQWVFGFEQHIEWTEINGVMVPVKFEERRPRVIRDVNGDEHVDFQEHQIILKWLSLNEELASENFDGSLIRDLAAFERRLSGDD